MNGFGSTNAFANIMARAVSAPNCPSGYRDPKAAPGSDCIPLRIVTQASPPPGYAPPGVQPVTTTPESKTGLYIGLGLAAVVVVGGAYLLFGRPD